MSNLKDYDYQRHPGVPDGVASVQWFFSAPKKLSLLVPLAPWIERPAMACFYDANDNLVHTRFINSDGTYHDAK